MPTFLPRGENSGRTGGVFGTVFAHKNLITNPDVYRERRAHKEEEDLDPRIALIFTDYCFIF